MIERYLVITEDLNQYTTETIDENLKDDIAEEKSYVITFKHESFWLAYIDENDNVCWEEIQ